jgi:dissimilatory sulfite reductase related protein
MTHRQYAGIDIIVDEEGYFMDPGQWNPAIGIAVAREEEMVLSEKHLNIIIYLRTLYFEGNALSIRSINQSGIVNLKEFYSMFPGAPLKKAARIGGLPNPKSCV